jgi:DNA modification methylase
MAEAESDSAVGLLGDAESGLKMNCGNRVSARSDMETALALATIETTFKNKIINADALTLLHSLPSNSVNCIVTSPPYFGQRDYQVEGQVGLERTVQEYIAVLTRIFYEAHRVLRKDGTLWVNIADTYVGSTSQHKQGGSRGHNSIFADRSASGIPTTGRKERNKALYQQGLKRKDLIGVPFLLAFALRDVCQYYWRSDIIWAKPNPMPESVKDRPTNAHEYIFLFSKSNRYYYDWQSIVEPSSSGDTTAPRGSKGAHRQNRGNRKEFRGGGKYTSGLSYDNSTPVQNSTPGNNNIPNINRQKRTIWEVPTQPCEEAHFATFPARLIEPMILAGCPEGGIVLDMFMGAGTTALVARSLGRNFIGSELNPEYVAMANRRLQADEYKRQAADPFQPTEVRPGLLQTSLFELA